MPNNNKPSRPRDRKSRHDPSSAQARPTLLSKALSRLLRHAAAQEKIPIDSLGYVRLDQLLAWRGLGKFQPPVEVQEIIECVRDSEKARFGLRYAKDAAAATDVDEERVKAEGKAVPDESIEQASTAETETQRALASFDAGTDVEPKHFYIRANQGHSMVGVSSEGLLKPITADEVPATVVHGTFYGAWEAILKEGSISRMGRNHVHFSTGPPVEVARGPDGSGPDAETQNEGRLGEKGRLGKMMTEAGVISGMRRDAEVLIYVDVRASLDQGMKWWRSENGVVLTDGALPAEGEEGVGSLFWTEVVEVKEGLGTLWKDGRVVLELPERMKGRALPMGKGRRGGARRGRGGANAGEGGKGAGGKGAGRGGRGGKPAPNLGRTYGDDDDGPDGLDGDEARNPQ